MRDNIELVIAFMALWTSPEGIKTAFRHYFTPETVYENIGMSRTVGIDEALAFVEGYDQTHSGGYWTARTLSIAADGAMVLTERVDEMLDGSGTVLHSARVIGAFEVRDGKIVAWRDYFDSRSIPLYEGPGCVLPPAPAAPST